MRRPSLTVLGVSMVRVVKAMTGEPVLVMEPNATLETLKRRVAECLGVAQCLPAVRLLLGEEELTQAALDADGEATVQVVLDPMALRVSESIVNLVEGTASEADFDDAELILSAVESVGYAIPIFAKASPTLRNDREFLKRLIAVSKGGSSVLRVATAEHALDREIVMLAAAACPDGLEATKRLADCGIEAERERAKAILKDADVGRAAVSAPDGVLAFCYLHPSVWDSLGLTKDFLLKALMACDRALYAGVVFGLPEGMREDREVVCECVKRNGNILDFLPRRWLQDLEVVVLAATKGIMRRELAERLAMMHHSNAEVLAPLLRLHPHIYNLVSEDTQSILSAAYLAGLDHKKYISRPGQIMDFNPVTEARRAWLKGHR